MAVDQHRAGAALGEAAAEFRVSQAEIVAQGIEQRHIRICIYGMRLAIDIQFDAFGHVVLPLSIWLRRLALRLCRSRSFPSLRAMPAGGYSAR